MCAFTYYLATVTKSMQFGQNMCNQWCILDEVPYIVSRADNKALILRARSFLMAIEILKLTYSNGLNLAYRQTRLFYVNCSLQLRISGYYNLRQTKHRLHINHF